jgi:hypothetical protein
MDTQMHNRTSTRTSPNVGGRACLGLFWLALLAGTVRAASPDNQWQINVPLYLTAGSHYYTSGNASGAFNLVSASVEAILSSAARPYSAGLFVDYSYSTDSRHDGSVNAGALFEYEKNNWDTNTFVFASKSPGAPSLWLYAGRVRYQFAENHKFGIGLVGTLRDPEASTLLLGYYSTISRFVSLNFVVGTTLKSGSDRAARTELVWQIK